MLRILLRGRVGPAGAEADPALRGPLQSTKQAPPALARPGHGELDGPLRVGPASSSCGAPPPSLLICQVIEWRKVKL